MMWLTLLLQSAPSPETVPVTTMVAGRGYPRELLEPVTRYGTCMSDQFNAGMRAIGGVERGAQVHAIYAKARPLCRDVRVAAAQEGNLILQKQGVKDPAKRAAIVEDALGSVDDQENVFAAMVDSSNSPEAVAARKAQTNAPKP